MPLKILYVITSLQIGGAEKLVVDMAILIKDRGFSVKFLIFSPLETILTNKLEKHGIEILKSYNIHLYNPLHAFKLRSLIGGYDIIHVHLFPSLYWSAFAHIFSNSEARFIYTEHSTSNRRRQKKILQLIDRYVYKQYDKIVTISGEVEKSLKEHLKLPECRYIRIENGIDFHEIHEALPANELFFPFKEDNQKLILQVSSFRWQKDQKTLIRALRELPVNIKLLLAGDGPLIGECKNYAREMNVFDRIKFLGIRNDIPQLLKAVDIVVLSSNHEGLSLASIEGMASGRPFIASDVPGLRDIVKGAGLLFPKGNEKILATHISELLADNTYYQEVVRACIERSKAFDISKMVERYLALYMKVTSK